MFYQQGDVKIHSLPCKLDGRSAINKIPKDAKKVAPTIGKLILKEGELTGHAHAITNPVQIQNDVEMYEHEGTLFLSVKSPVEVTHQEHGTQVIEKGDYVIDSVQEVDHFTEEIRSVTD